MDAMRMFNAGSSWLGEEGKPRWAEVMTFMLRLEGQHGVIQV